MSDQALDDAVEQIVEDMPKRRFSGKKIVLFLLLPLVVIVGGGAAVFVSGILDGLLGDHEAVQEEEEAAAAVEGPGYFYDLPDILVNLNTAERRQSFLSIKVSLELNSQEDLPMIQQVMPRIVNNFQIYLRELRLDDLRGSAGIYRLREELTRRVNAAIAPAAVRDVLFQEMLVQ